MKTMARNDSKIRNSYINKSIGGYIDIINTLEEEEDNNNILLKYELLYDKMGVLNNYQEIWEIKLEEVKKYIDENNKRPSKHDKDNNIKRLGTWIGTQLKNYSKKEYIMKNDIIREKWEEFISKYKIYFLSNEEEWLNKLEIVKKYIDENNKRPSTSDKDNNINKLGIWISHQIKNYLKREFIMKNDMIKEKWEQFINNVKYKEYFISNEELWEYKLVEVKKYIDANNKRPLITDKDNNIKVLAKWIGTQLQNYSNKKQIMKNDIIREKWEKFINDIKYKEYFISNEEIWKYKLEEVKKYIDDNNKRPSSHDKDNNIKILDSWISKQKINYLNNEKIMKNDIIREQWEEFINDAKYRIYFISNEEEWLNKLEIVKKYINKNNKRPSSKDKDNNIKTIGLWIIHQIKNYLKKEYIMKNDMIRRKWEEFINDTKYKEYFISNEDEWCNTLEEVKKYIDENNKKPSFSDNNSINTLGNWIYNQTKNYSKKQEIMKNDMIRGKWEEFINDIKYKKHLTSTEKIWHDTLEIVKKYIDDNNKRPSECNKDNDIKILGKWISRQKEYYSKTEYIMKNNIIREKWLEFINDIRYKKYFNKTITL
jgi:hypothetical protein